MFVGDSEINRCAPSPTLLITIITVNIYDEKESSFLHMGNRIHLVLTCALTNPIACLRKGTHVNSNKNATVFHGHARHKSAVHPPYSKSVYDCGHRGSAEFPRYIQGTLSDQPPD